MTRAFPFEEWTFGGSPSLAGVGLQEMTPLSQMVFEFLVFVLFLVGLGTVSNSFISGRSLFRVMDDKNLVWTLVVTALLLVLTAIVLTRVIPTDPQHAP